MEDFVLLSQEDTLKLIKLAKSGDVDAKQKLVECNFPLIKSVVARFRMKNLEYDDLYQLGSLGFLKAVLNFDESFGVRFSTYAVPMIAGEIKRFLRDDGTIKVSRAIKSLSASIQKFLEEFRKCNDHEPSITEIAKHFDIEEHEIVFAMEAGQTPISISDRNESSENGLAILDKIAVSDGGENKLLSDIALKQSIALLSEKERKIVYLRFFVGKTQSEIAEMMNVSQVQISRLENKILIKLKNKLKD